MIEELREALAKNGTLTLTVRVHPHARQTRLTAMLADGSYKIDVKAPADAGKANEELFSFLSTEFAVGLSGIVLKSGKTSRRKIIRITKKP